MQELGKSLLMEFWAQMVKSLLTVMDGVPEVIDL
jgi:hypothetical protein